MEEMIQIPKSQYTELLDLMSIMFEDKTKGHLYCAEFEDGKVKIGRTTHPDQRMYQLTHQYRKKYCKIVRAYFTGEVTGASSKEQEAMKGLKPERGKKELFSIAYEEGVRRVKSVTKVGTYIETCNWEETIKEFPSAGPPASIESMARCLRNLVEACVELKALSQ